ncbi:hypothetical protein N0V90_009074 [Kalmusia sp. IMI 367209]|nr:hypothetical protein N0V90_009074 [Kalmusia sp. IMI 367209]
MNEPAHLCLECTFLKTRLASEANFYCAIAANFAALEASSAEGCPLCRIIRQRLIHRTRIGYDALCKNNSKIYLTATLDYILINSPVEGTGGVELWPSPGHFLAGTTDYRDDSLQWETARNLETQSYEIHSLHDPEGLNATALMARRWISECLDKHTTCQMPFGATKMPNAVAHAVPKLPTRVIDVGTGSGPPEPRILVPNVDQRADYFALSYSWGKGMYPARMTQKNLAQMQERIVMKNLPKTIQDAIIFTKLVGLTRYLWVDALCIVQTKEQDVPGDDQAHISDWNIESRKFGSYYHNALCTLAATGTSCSTEGLFLDRPGLRYPTQPCHLRRFSPSGIPRGMIIEQVPPSWWESIQNGPLFGRGWTVQERALSMRMLHFSRDSVLWECKEVKSSETSPDGLGVDDELAEDGGEDLTNPQSLFRKAESGGCELAWYEFVPNYSRCQFTFFSDRMAALSGLAGRMQKLTGEKYYAGLWEQGIEAGLAWVSIRLASPKTSSSSEYIAPSWSWTCLPFASNVRFLWPHYTGPSMLGEDLGIKGDWHFPLEVIDVKIETGGPDATGTVRYGRIEARGSLLHLDMGKARWLKGQDHRRPNYLVGASSKDPDSEKPIIGLYLDTMLPDEFSTLPATLPCLLVAEEENEDTQKEDLKLAAIVLKLTGKRYDGFEEYTRIGLVIMPRSYFDMGADRVTLYIV